MSGNPNAEQPAPTGAPESPFVGLDPYSSDDASFFFGREREQRVIVANLTAARVTLLYGPSGVGKSSVLNAGVVPALLDLAEEGRREAVGVHDPTARTAADGQVPG